MNVPDFSFWTHLLARLSVEVCLLAALGSAAQRLLGPAVWQRAVWRVVLVCLLLLPLSEWTGFGAGAAGFLFGHRPATERLAITGAPSTRPEVARPFASAKLISPPALREVWWPGWIWLAGAALVLGRVAAGQVLLLTLRSRREMVPGGPLSDRVGQVANCIGLRRKVMVLRMPQAISPMAFGIARSCIGLPPGFETKLSVASQEAVLAHELGHLAAMDPLWFLLADFASAVLWWHPLVWWARRSLHGAAELAADEATTLLPGGPGALADCLVRLGQEMAASRPWGWIGINGGFRSELGKRVERLTRMSRAPQRPWTGWLSLVVPAIVLCCGALQSARAQKADSWGGQLRESWQVSPAALLLLAVAENNQTETSSVTNQIRDAKLLYEKGKLDEAEALFNRVLKDDPSNGTPPYYLDLIKEARYMINARLRGQTNVEADWAGRHPPVSNPIQNTNLIYTTKARQRIRSKLHTIMFDNVELPNPGLPLKEVLLKLRGESQKLDPDHIGVNFMINSDIGTGATIKISHALHKLSLGDVLDVITKVSDKPIRYTIEDYAVVFSPKPVEKATLYSKTFHVDPGAFTQGLQKVVQIELIAPITRSGATGLGPDGGGQGAGGGGASIRGGGQRTLEAHELVRQYFTQLGVDLTPPKMILFNDHSGILLVRATLPELDMIQQVVEMLDKPPPQITIDTKFVELPPEDHHAFITGGLTNTNKIAGVGLLTPAEFRSTMAALAQLSGVNVLGVPKVTFESGRQMHAGVMNGGEGVETDALAVVEPDGFSISMQAIPRIKSGEQTLQTIVSETVRDGDTLAVELGEITDPLFGARKIVWAYVTPRITGSTGNPAHTDKEIEEQPANPPQ